MELKYHNVLATSVSVPIGKQEVVNIDSPKQCETLVSLFIKAFKPFAGEYDFQFIGLGLGERMNNPENRSEGGRGQKKVEKGW